MFSRDCVQGHDKYARVYVNQNKNGEFTDTIHPPGINLSKATG